MASSIVLPVRAFATTELDRQFALESIGFLRPWDNVDYLFADTVADAYKTYFASQSRFKLQDLTKASQVLVNAKTPYQRLIDDPEILGQLARSMRVESILRTKIMKEGPQYRFTIQWLLSPKMEVLADEQFMLDDARDGKALAMGDLKGRLNQALGSLIKKVPFLGMVSGRDDVNVTLNIGGKAGLKRGDRVLVGTLDEVKRHPLLKTVVEWVVTPTGKVEIDDVDDAIAFGHVVEENEGRQVARFQKVTQIIPAVAKPSVTTTAQTTQAELEQEYQEPARLGWGGANVWLGVGSRSYSQGTNQREGSGISLGFEGRGELWFTRNWFSTAGLSFGTNGFSAKREDGTLFAGAGSISMFSLDLAGGYTYFATPSLFGPKAWIKLGYHSRKYSMTAVASEFQSPISFNGLFLGVGGELPVRGQFGGVIDLNFGVINSASQTLASIGTLSGANDVQVYLGGYYRWQPRMTLRAGINLITDSADVSGAGSVTHRIISIGPSLLYYF